MASLAIAEAFALPKDVNDAKDLVKSMDFSKCVVTSTETTELPLNFCLAPSYGKLTSASVKLMDDKLKIMITGVTKLIAKLEDKSWANVLGALQQCSVLEPMDDGQTNTDKFTKNYGTSVFKVDGSADKTVVKEVEQWFKALVGGKFFSPLVGNKREEEEHHGGAVG
jgi:hypothetical protein